MILQNINNGKIVVVKQIEFDNLSMIVWSYDNYYNYINGITPVASKVDITGLVAYNDGMLIINMGAEYASLGDNDNVWLHNLRPIRLIINNDFAFDCWNAVNDNTNSLYLIANLMEYIKSNSTVPRYKGDKWTTVYLEEIIDVLELGVTKEQILLLLDGYKEFIKKDDYPVIEDPIVEPINPE